MENTLAASRTRQRERRATRTPSVLNISISPRRGGKTQTPGEEGGDGRPTGTLYKLQVIWNKLFGKRRAPKPWRFPPCGAQPPSPSAGAASRSRLHAGAPRIPPGTPATPGGSSQQAKHTNIFPSAQDGNQHFFRESSWVGFFFSLRERRGGGGGVFKRHPE